MNAHILADYSARLREPEVIALIRSVIREVATSSGVPAKELLAELHGTHWHRNARLRGEIGRRLIDLGFRTRDVAEIFNQKFGTTLSQIQAAQFRHRAQSQISNPKSPIPNLQSPISQLFSLTSSLS